jgi:hypothetical protein
MLKINISKLLNNLVYDLERVKKLKILAIISSFNIIFDSNFQIGRKLKMHGIEMNALSLNAGFMFIESENDLFKQQKKLNPTFN